MSEHEHLDDVLADPDGAGLDDDISPELIELEKVPRHLWEQTLAPWHPQLRFFATHRIPDDHLREQAQTLVMEMNDADRRRRHARDDACAALGGPRRRCRHRIRRIPRPSAACR